MNNYFSELKLFLQRNLYIVASDHRYRLFDRFDLMMISIFFSRCLLTHFISVNKNGKASGRDTFSILMFCIGTSFPTSLRMLYFESECFTISVPLTMDKSQVEAK